MEGNIAKRELLSSKDGDATSIKVRGSVSRSELRLSAKASKEGLEQRREGNISKRDMSDSKDYHASIKVISDIKQCLSIKPYYCYPPTL